MFFDFEFNFEFQAANVHMKVSFGFILLYGVTHKKKEKLI